MPTANPASKPEALSPAQIDLVRRHLEEVKASHAFAGSKRTQDFLHLVVEHALDGEVDSLRERMIGVEMFGRPVDYDTGNDSVVRVKATEVRKKLAEYYLETDRTPAVRIELPRGSYVPKFIFEPLEHLADHSQGGTRPVNHPIHSVSNAYAATEPVSAAAPAAESVAMPPLGPQPHPRQWWLLPVAAMAVIVLGAAGYLGFRKWRGEASAEPEIRSIVILPLQNLSGDPRQDYFADGVTEELINDLGQVSTLRVISLTSSMSYKGTKKNLPEIARELSVEGVVEGGVLRDGDQVRISVQLIDARSDRPVWAHTYTRDLNGVLAWQGELAQAIADEISVDVTPQEQARLAGMRTIAPDVQDLYLHGILLRDANDCNQAISYFDRAITADPGYAQAHSALASCYGMLGESGRMPYEEAFSRQKAEALQAIQLDDSLPEAHAELANSAMTLDRDWPTAEAEFRRALELNPNSAPSHEKYAFFLVRTGHPEQALAEVQRSIDLDPVSTSTFHAEGFIYYFSHHYDEALAVTQTAQGLKVDLPDWNFLVGDIYAEKGMYAASIAAFLKSGSGPYALGHLGNVYARAGRTARAKELIAQIQKDVRKNGIGRYEIALVYAGLGDKQHAFQWLEDAYRAHDVGLVYLKVDPCLDPLRSDPRYADLMKREGLSRANTP
jgi:TolB-like protein/Flp pilus assembly protein TadD